MVDGNTGNIEKYIGNFGKYSQIVSTVLKPLKNPDSLSVYRRMDETYKT